ncbi:ribosomal protein S18-alanine N-acetyltransferase [Peptacetobacter sp.]|uniref:ribosomal protein S18-alanine N-acetyltransferase n=1 Tax=Peptacetobacter sp. TaxID=2991975 RepID=UPI0026080E03|nr:ribosomal protein S18-alanine N-acetyltransferase [Peptacetobacter sp.]
MESKVKISELVIREMTINDVDGVFEVEKNCFEDFWSKQSFIDEIKNNNARYLVAQNGSKIVGYIGIWLILDEGHITNVAVHSDYRGLKIGNELLKEMVNLCKENNIIAMTLEVRKSNEIAQNLYKKYGFKMAGIRKEYYSDNREDAIIMWNHLSEV